MLFAVITASRARLQRRRGWIRGWTHAAVLLGYLLLTVVMTWPLVTQFTVAIPGDAFDGWQNYWNLWWVKVALVERIQNPYTTDLLYYPTGVSLYFHTLNPFNGLVTLPIQFSAGLFAAYNCVVLLSWVLAGYGMWLLARWVIARIAGQEDARCDLAAFVAGAIFTFAPVHMAHLLGHMQVMALEWLPFYTLALLRAIHRGQQGQQWVRDALLAGLFLTLAGLCDWYFVLYLFLLTGMIIIGTWLVVLVQRGGRAQHWWGALLPPLLPPLLAGATFALLLSPILIPMVTEATRYSFMVRPSSDLYIFSATALDFVLPNRLHTLFRPQGLTAWGNQVAPLSERTIGVGYAALALAAAALVTARRGAKWATRGWGMAALLFALLALGPSLHLVAITPEEIPTNGDVLPLASPYAVVNALVPFMRISRSVSRFAIMVQMSVAVLAAMGLVCGLQRLRPRTAIAAAVVVLTLVLAEFWVAPYPMSPPDTPDFYTTAAQSADRGALLNLPMNYDRPGYLLYQTVHQRPLTVAYISRDDPRTLTERVPLLQHWRHLGPDILAADPVQVGMTVLHDLGVTTVVLDRYKMPGGEERAYTESLANALFAGRLPTYQDERLTVYTVEPPQQAQPYLELGPLHWGPLVHVEGNGDDTRARTVVDGPAEVWLRHVPRGARIVIDYAGDAAAMVSSTDGSSWPLPATERGSVTVELPPGVEQLTFAAPNGTLHVHRLTLQTP